MIKSFGKPRNISIFEKESKYEYDGFEVWTNKEGEINQFIFNEGFNEINFNNFIIKEKENFWENLIEMDGNPKTDGYALYLFNLGISICNYHDNAGNDYGINFFDNNVFSIEDNDMIDYSKTI